MVDNIILTSKSYGYWASFFIVNHVDRVKEDMATREHARCYLRKVLCKYINAHKYA